MRILALSLSLGLMGAAFISPTIAGPDGVRIGVLSDMSGPYLDVGGKGSVIAAEMAVADFGGSVLGKPITVLSADHQNKPETGSAIARRWYDQDGVDLITDLTNSSVSIAVQAVAKEKRRINIASNTATTAITGEYCAPNSFHWTYNAYSLSHGTAREVVSGGGKSWFFITTDLAFGHNLEANATSVITEMGGKVLGRALAPINTADFSSHLLRAQSSGAQVVGLALSGADLANAIKQAEEFNLGASSKMTILLGFLTDIKAIGLQKAQGAILTTAFYWDLNDETRQWSQRFFKLHGAMPTMVHAGTYSALMHFLKAVKEAGTTDPDKVTAVIRKNPVSDFAFKGHVRPDGMMIHELYLVSVKKPGESTGPWDLYRPLRTIAAEDAFQPLSESKCPLVNPAKQ